MSVYATGSLLAQVRPTDTLTATAFTATVPTEITRIVATNTESAAGGYDWSLFHSDDGTETYDKTTALRYEKNIPENATEIIASFGYGGVFTLSAGGSIGVQMATGSTITVCIYGTTADLAPSNRR